MILLYEDSDYAFAVDEFLANYYLDQQTGFPFEQRIHGRCGYIRQAFPLIIKDYDFNKFSLVLDGPNSQLSDIDFYVAIQKAIAKSTSFGYDLAPYYYRKNTYITAF